MRLRQLLMLPVFLFCAFGAGLAHAQSLPEALAQAYEANPQLNAARAALRVTNEGVPQALSGYRPQIFATGDIGWQTSVAQTPGGNVGRVSKPAGVGVSIDQTLFDGFRTDNTTRQAETLVLVQREVLRTTEQDVLFQAASVYMDVVRDSAILNLRDNFSNLLGEQLQATNERFDAGEVTKTDVAQGQARLSLAKSQIAAARAQLNASRANYRRIIGSDPQKLIAKNPFEKFLPSSLQGALSGGSLDHPQVRAATYGIDAAEFAVKIAESSLYPSVSVGASVTRRFEPQSTVDRLDTAAVVGQVTVPIYQGGLPDSQVRQSKELLGQRRIEVDTVRDQIRALIVANWGNYDAAKAQIEAVSAQIRANDLALTGVREEAKVGQRTILDSLNAQQELLDSRVSLIISERDRVVASFALLGAVGRLNAQTLGLKVAAHDPTAHYGKVRDKWQGLRTPSGE